MNTVTIRKLAAAGGILGFSIAAMAVAMLYFQGEESSVSPTIGRFVAVERPLADFAFTDGAGKSVHLADFAGKVLLLNLWATWCAPCVKEMPSLDRLQAELGGPNFQVLAVAQDREGGVVVLPFMKELGIKALLPYLDASASAGKVLGVQGLPTSILIGRDGREIARLLGGADWDSTEFRHQIGEARERTYSRRNMGSGQIVEESGDRR